MTPKEMITVEKEVYDVVLINSVRVNDLEKENRQLKELLKECREKSFEIRLALSSGKINDVFTLTYQIENKIDNAIGENK